MSYRGYGGFGTVPRSRPRAGDLSDISLDDPGSYDESAGLDLSSSPDFSDVVGGSSTVTDPSDILSSGLGSLDFSGLGSKALQLLGGGGGGSALGSVAAAGAAAVGSKTIRKKLARLIGGGGRRRRMNPGNFKALRRSMHRLQVFERAARKVVHFTHPKPTARVKFRFHRRRKR